MGRALVTAAVMAALCLAMPPVEASARRALRQLSGTTGTVNGVITGGASNTATGVLTSTPTNTVGGAAGSGETVVTTAQGGPSGAAGAAGVAVDGVACDGSRVPPTDPAARNAIFTADTFIFTGTSAAATTARTATNAAADAASTASNLNQRTGATGTVSGLTGGASNTAAGLVINTASGTIGGVPKVTGTVPSTVFSAVRGPVGAAAVGAVFTAQDGVKGVTCGGSGVPLINSVGQTATTSTIRLANGGIANTFYIDSVADNTARSTASTVGGLNSGPAGRRLSQLGV
ncbi:hypothetical protein MNEG_0101 [Monoraphidium neglectum]|uniref:Uncharacterized protein n=1 Tax=Monoraphidium neglectum TaxID=145388 RepID=A0A0D2KCN1_9CHLO|nr:hypothetical protein MNEG_0101 [Monoraphidium neglectum]KIZ07848.1 hypothetical protein MNEG_0101 [Monoraphidium neglectum]|eukprot:XP_013906867.1 hypothetical protein MNEG_0101 [Monoraphidium neglectum]